MKFQRGFLDTSAHRRSPDHDGSLTDGRAALLQALIFVTVSAVAIIYDEVAPNDFPTGALWVIFRLMLFVGAAQILCIALLRDEYRWR